MFFEKLKNFTLSHFIVAILALFTASCATQKPITVKSDIPQQTNTQQSILNALDYVELSKEQAPEQAIVSMLIASELYLQEGNPLKSLWLANQIAPLLSNENLLYRVIQVKANSLFSLGYADESFAQLSTLAELSSSHNTAYYQLLAQLQTQRGFPVLALAAQLQLFPLKNDANIEDAQALWLAFQQLTPWQVTEIENKQLPYGKGWVRLTQFANQFGHNEAQFSRYITQWQRQYPTHPANILLDEITASLANTYLSKENIAVLLPLSGKQQAAGNAAQQGILAAYANQPNSKLHFYDTETLDWQTLPEQLTANEVQIVIGPLLRNNVKQYLTNEALNLPTLLLNLPQDTELAAHQFAISMRPEDEAIQAAATLSKKQYKKPIVLVHQDKVSQRIATTFTNEWARITGEKPRVMPFSKGKKMQSMLKTALDVYQSEARIQDLNRRIKHTIKADARNRRDVDMIYIVGSPTQTRLLKPYIDVSISPFAKMIPIYASSRSHSAKTDESDARDLAGLTFSEMPWLLASSQQDKQLKALSKSLFPERSDSLQRIFAMGFDALNLVNKIEKMAVRPYIKHFGQTGILTLNNKQILTRSLIWGRYKKESVTEIAMD